MSKTEWQLGLEDKITELEDYISKFITKESEMEEDLNV